MIRLRQGFSGLFRLCQISGWAARRSLGAGAVLVLALLVPVPSGASWAFVQAKQNSASLTSVDAVFTSDNTAGCLIVVGVEANSTSSTTTVSDTKGNSYASAQGPQTYTGANQYTQIFYAFNCASGPNTVTASNSSATYMNIVAAEYSGFGASDPIDGSGAAATGDGTAISSGSFTVTVNDLVVGFALGSDGSTTAVSGTSRGTDNFSMLEDQNASSTSASADFSQTGSTHWNALGAAFKIPSASGTKGTATGAGTITGAGTVN